MITTTTASIKILKKDRENSVEDEGRGIIFNLFKLIK
jgi:hypothetical protein